MFKDLIIALKDKNDDLVEKLLNEIRIKQNAIVNKGGKTSPN